MGKERERGSRTRKEKKRKEKKIDLLFVGVYICR